MEQLDRRLAAVLMADVVGSSRLIEADESYALASIYSVIHEVLVVNASNHQGRLIKTLGDGALIEFGSPMSAVACAQTVQAILSERAAEEPEDRRIKLRIGINLGEVTVRPDGDIYGDCVNVAARLEGLAESGGVAISAKVYGELQGELAAAFEDQGEQALKNIARPVRVFALRGSHPQMVANSLNASRMDKPTIAVLPFVNMSGDPEQEYMADGIAEDLITELSRIKGFLVIARNSSFTYKGRAIEVKQIGRELAVRYVLEGSVRRLGFRVRITAQMIDARTGGHIWAEKYDRELADLFQVQDEVVRSTVASTQTQVVVSEGDRVPRAEHINLDIWQLRKRGLTRMYELTRESLTEMKRLGQQIVSIDPANSGGHQLIAAADFHLIYLGFLPDEAEMREEALKHAQEAVRLDRHDEYSLWTLGLVLGVLLSRVQQGVAAYRQALEVNPNFSLGYGSLATTFVFAGYADEAIENAQISIRLNPRDPSVFFRYANLSLAYFLKSDYKEAAEWADRAAARKSDWWLALALLAASRAILGDNEAAREAGYALISLRPEIRVSRLPMPVIQEGPQREAFHRGLLRAGLTE